MNCPECRERLADNVTACECGWRAPGKTAASKVAKCERCPDRPAVWRGTRMLCTRCYDDVVHPVLPGTLAEIAMVKRLRDIEAWIVKHPEFKTRRDACLHALKARGLVNLLPEKLRE